MEEATVPVPISDLNKWIDLVRTLGLAGMMAAQDTDPKYKDLPELNRQAIQSLMDTVQGEINQYM